MSACRTRDIRNSWDGGSRAARLAQPLTQVCWGRRPWRRRAPSTVHCMQHSRARPLAASPPTQSLLRGGFSRQSGCAVGFHMRRIANMSCCPKQPSIYSKSVPFGASAATTIGTNHQQQSPAPITSTDHQHQSPAPITSTNHQYQSVPITSTNQYQSVPIGINRYVPVRRKSRGRPAVAGAPLPAPPVRHARGLTPASSWGSTAAGCAAPGPGAAPAATGGAISTASSGREWNSTKC
jgi:hypothetical protein